MIIKNKKGYGYNDLTIVPADLSLIKSRSDVNPFNKEGGLPIFTAPMSGVVNCENFELWKRNGITPILPRNIDFEKRFEYFRDFEWIAVSLTELSEIKSLFDKKVIPCIEGLKYKLCVDVANGNMMSLISSCCVLKNEYGAFVEIMTGNIANPETIKYYKNAGIDYVRCSVGSGSGCTTASNTAIHYPVATLIEECYNTRGHNSNLKIIADGGIRNYSDVIKALALGADYVMIGGVFASFLESAAPLHFHDLGVSNDEGKIECREYEGCRVGSNREQQKERWGEAYEHINPVYETDENGMVRYFYYVFNIWSKELPEIVKRKFIENNSNGPIGLTKEFFGMSTKQAQRLIKDEANLKTSEGTTKIFDVKYTIKQWCDNMESYLRSAMSYCGAVDLNNFIGQQQLIVNSINENKSVNK